MAESRISRISSASAEATTVTLGTHAKGDIILIFAFRDGSTTNPSIPAGWTNVTNTTDGTSCSVSIGWKIAISAADSSGTWTNATGLMCHVYRGVDHVRPFGTLTANAGTTSPSTYGATTGVTKARMDNQWFVAFQAHRSIDTTTLSNAPTGYTNIINALGATQDMVSFDTNGPVQNGFASNTVAPGGTASGWQTCQLPIYPAMQRLNNYQAARSVSAGIISIGEKLR